MALPSASKGAAINLTRAMALDHAGDERATAMRQQALVAAAHAPPRSPGEHQPAHGHRRCRLFDHAAKSSGAGVCGPHALTRCLGMGLEHANPLIAKGASGIPLGTALADNHR